MVIKKRLGEILVDKNVITEKQLQEALNIQRSSGQRLGQVLIRLGYVTEQDLIDILEEHIDTERVSLKDIDLDPNIVRIIPEHIARRHKGIPIGKKGNTLQVAMADPLNVVAIDDFQLKSRMDIEPVLALESEIERALNKIYGMEEFDDSAFEALLSDLETSAALDDISEEKLQVNYAPIVRVVNSIIRQAVKLRASDIHIEPQENYLRVRFRVDGILKDVMSLPRNSHPLITSRIKIMGQMDIAEKRVPQDGRFNVEIKDSSIDLRVSTLPTVYGEKIVLRILDKANMLLDLEKLGLSKMVFDKYKELISRPYGMILVTGPTGSGKTTTLYATLQKINKPEKNIITIEDPVEYMLKGINQTAINPKAGVTFASGLRAILRQDPDIIMVGEIRDKETAQIAIQAANTGHLVFSTLHTNDAVGAITRLLDMGIEPYLVASSVIGVLAQRLVRVICPQCKKKISVPPDGKERVLLGIPKDEPLTIYKGERCPACEETGFRGRTSVTELLEINSTIAKLILKKASSKEYKNVLRNENVPTLWQDAVSKVMNGITTVDEITRIFVNEVE